MRRFLIVMIGLIVPFLCSAVEPVDPFHGDWKGKLKGADGKKEIFAQVIAEGNGMYRARLLETLEKRVKPVAVLKGQAKEGVLTLESGDWMATLDNKKFVGTGKDSSFSMKRYDRSSPTLGKKVPKGAVVLLDGKSVNEWQHFRGQECNWKLTDVGSMQVTPRAGGSVISKKEFGDAHYHIEFRTPFMPKAKGQGRGNSGVYFQGRYEVQILDSYGLYGRDNECGGIYKVSEPKVNMCLAPMQWQTYDVDFTAAKFDDAGKKTSKARITVVHNGVLIHEDLQIPRTTGASKNRDEKGKAGLMLQDHGNPVEYRNIWVVEK